MLSHGIGAAIVLFMDLYHSYEIGLDREEIRPKYQTLQDLRKFFQRASRIRSAQGIHTSPDQGQQAVAMIDTLLAAAFPTSHHHGNGRRPLLQTLLQSTAKTIREMKDGARYVTFSFVLPILYVTVIQSCSCFESSGHQSSHSTFFRNE